MPSNKALQMDPHASRLVTKGRVHPTMKILSLITHVQKRTGHWEHRENSRWPGSQFGLLPYVCLLLFLSPAECTKVIISEFAIQ